MKDLPVGALGEARTRRKLHGHRLITLLSADVHCVASGGYFQVTHRIHADGSLEKRGDGSPLMNDALCSIIRTNSLAGLPSPPPGADG